MQASQARRGLCAPSTSYGTASRPCGASGGHTRSHRRAWQGLRSCAAVEDDNPLLPPPHEAVALLPAPSDSHASRGEALRQAKQRLLDNIRYTRRGANTTKALRGVIEEVQVAVENHAPAELDYGLLAGKWRLLYTTAPDVLPILGLQSAPLSWLPVPRPIIGNIYQRFSTVNEGRVENIIEFGLTQILDGPKGATLTVGARYEVRSPKRIALVFEEARLGSVHISPDLEAFLAPAILPRGGLNMAALMALRELDVRVPFRTAQQVAAQRSVAASYLLTYLDEDMLIGRATLPTGTFIFERDQEEAAGQTQPSAKSTAQ